MQTLTLLLLWAAAFVSALPEPIPAPKPLCSRLASRCHDPATRYCSKNLITTTTATDGGPAAATVTAFPTDYPCLNVQNAKAKRADKVPKCLTKIVQSGGDAALTSACACYSIYPSTVTEGGTAPTETVYASRFYMQADKDESKYAVNGLSYSFSGVGTLFGFDKSAAYTYTLNNQCQLVDEDGIKAYASPSESTDTVIWYGSGQAPGGKDPITCGISGNNLDNLQCLSGSKLYTAFVPNSQYNAWEMTSNNQADLFNIYVTPTTD